MSEEDDASKTEEPTGKRLEKAREEGNVPISQEIKSLMMLIGGIVAVGMFAPRMARDLSNLLRPFIARPHELPTDFEGLRGLLAGTLLQVGLILLFPIAILVMLAFLSVVGQVGFVYSPKRIAPSLDKLSIIKGVKQFFSLRRLVELGKSLAKLALVGLALGFVVWPQLDWILRLPEMETVAMLLQVRVIIIILIATVLGVMLAVAFADMFFVRYQSHKKLKMTKQEVKDEHKQSEGDPQVKSRIRSIRLERFRKRMMQAVPHADVVITNPTHFAVALSYKMEDMAAPKVVAKGVDFLAKRIRELAEENDVPIVENPPLARALYASVEVDQFIPPEHYRPVAEVISYVMKLKKKR
ncbi:flagellar biosynthesis protein FlhB [Oleispirillum naphthae]|uniref:flagellar biosynthesis protein FlhB n=1 Tax=Oleispirillum naphthae TaxID=2838853 RepID=UPI00308224F6